MSFDAGFVEGIGDTGGSEGGRPEAKDVFSDLKHNQLLFGEPTKNPRYPDKNFFLGELQKRMPQIDQDFSYLLELLKQAPEARVYQLPPGPDLAIYLDKPSRVIDGGALIIVRPQGTRLLLVDDSWRNRDRFVDDKTGELLPFSQSNLPPQRLGDNLVIYTGSISGIKGYTIVSPNGRGPSGILTPHQSLPDINAQIPEEASGFSPLDDLRKLQAETTIGDKITAYAGIQKFKGASYLSNNTGIGTISENAGRNPNIGTFQNEVCRRYGVSRITDIPPVSAYGRQFAITEKCLGYGATSVVVIGEDTQTKEEVAIKLGFHPSGNNDPIEASRTFFDEEITTYQNITQNERQVAALSGHSLYQEGSYSAKLGEGQIGDSHSPVPYLVMELLGNKKTIKADELLRDFKDITDSNQATEQEKETAFKMSVYLWGHYIDAAARAYGVMSTDYTINDLLIDPFNHTARVIDLNVIKPENSFYNWIERCTGLVNNLIIKNPSLTREQKVAIGTALKSGNLQEARNLLAAHQQQMKLQGKTYMVDIDGIFQSLLNYDRTKKEAAFPPNVQGMITVANLLHKAVNIPLPANPEPQGTIPRPRVIPESLETIDPTSLPEARTTAIPNENLQPPSFPSHEEVSKPLNQTNETIQGEEKPDVERLEAALALVSSYLLKAGVTGEQMQVALNYARETECPKKTLDPFDIVISTLNKYIPNGNVELVKQVKYLETIRDKIRTLFQGKEQLSAQDRLDLEEQVFKVRSDFEGGTNTFTVSSEYFSKYGFLAYSLRMCPEDVSLAIADELKRIGGKSTNVEKLLGNKKLQFENIRGVEFSFNRERNRIDMTFKDEAILGTLIK